MDEPPPLAPAPRSRRRGRRQQFVLAGPLFFLELVRLARRGRGILLRCGYGLLLLAALYLREYARAGPIVSAVRIAVNNLAGVPSIVFGVFGLGFFCYIIGGSIDDLFFRAKLEAALPVKRKGSLSIRP